MIDYQEEDFTRADSSYDRVLNAAGFRSIFANERALKPGGVYVVVRGSTSRIVQTALLGSLIAPLGSNLKGFLMHKPDSALVEFLDLGTDPGFQNAPIVQALHEAKRQGLCRYTGLSANRSEAIVHLLRRIEVDMC